MMMLMITFLLMMMLLLFMTAMPILRMFTFGSRSIMAYSVAEPRYAPLNWLATLNSSSVLVLMVDLMMSITISGETEFDSRFRARIDLFDSRQLQRRLQIGSVRLQLAAESDSTLEFSASDLNKFAHFSSEMYLMLFRLISVSSESLSPAFLITSSMYVLLGASCGNTLRGVAEQCSWKVTPRMSAMSWMSVAVAIWRAALYSSLRVPGSSTTSTFFCSSSSSLSYSFFTGASGSLGTYTFPLFVPASHLTFSGLSGSARAAAFRPSWSFILFSSPFHSVASFLHL